MADSGESLIVRQVQSAIKKSNKLFGENVFIGLALGKPRLNFLFTCQNVFLTLLKIMCQWKMSAEYSPIWDARDPGHQSLNILLDISGFRLEFKTFSPSRIQFIHVLQCLVLYPLSMAL